MFIIIFIAESRKGVVWAERKMKVIQRHVILLLKPSDRSLPPPLVLSLWLSARWISFDLLFSHVSSYLPPFRVKNLPDRRAMSLSTAWAISSCLFFGVDLFLLTWKSIIARSWIFPWWLLLPISTSWVFGLMVILNRNISVGFCGDCSVVRLWVLKFYEGCVKSENMKMCRNAGLLGFRENERLALRFERWGLHDWAWVFNLQSIGANRT